MTFWYLSKAHSFIQTFANFHTEQNRLFLVGLELVSKLVVQLFCIVYLDLVIKELHKYTKLIGKNVGLSMLEKG